MSILLFVLKTILVSGLLYGYYCLFLRNRAFSHYNRFFLLSIPVLSLLVPAFQLNAARWNQGLAASPVRLLAVVNGRLDETAAGYGHQPFWGNLRWESLLIAATGLVTLALGFRLYRSLRYLVNLRRGISPLTLEGVKVYPVRAEGTPFSFFASIFWNADQDLITSESHRILQHELYHVRHRHSLDILLLEILRSICWFNPFIHLIRREMQVIHEFLADAFAAGETDELEYARLLVTGGSKKALSIAQPFIQNSMKRRITMITRISKTKSGLLGRFMIIPVLVLLTLLFAFKLKTNPPAFGKTIRVVIDPGHSKTFPGVNVDGVEEQQVTLQIAQKISQFAAGYGVDVIMTRNDGEPVNHSASLQEDLACRASVAAREKADLFVSIHTNGYQPGEKNQQDGFEIYVPENSSPVYSGSVQLGSGISGFISKDYKTASQLKQPERHVLVLTRATVPAILMECGNLSNEADRHFITKGENQDKIAKDILAGIRQYALNSTGKSKSQTPDTLTLVADTISLDALKQKDPKTIYSIEVDKTKNRITAQFNDGKQAVVMITKEMHINLSGGNSPIRANE